MFTNVYDSVPNYHAPWDVSLEERLSYIKEGGKGKRIIWLYGHADTSTFRYRVFNMVVGLRNAKHLGCAASWFYEKEFSDLYEILPKVDCIVMCRMQYSVDLANFAYAAKSKGIKIWFDCDDLVFDVNYIPTILDTLDQDMRENALLNQWYAYVGRIEAVLRLCDFGIATNEFLAAKMKVSMGGGKVHILPNFLEREQQALSSAYFNNKCSNKFARNGELTIGYFSGSPSHNKDFLVAAGALLKSMRRHKNIKFKLVGFLDSLSVLSDVEDRIEHVPLQDYMNLQRLISEVEINISPLQNNQFTNCKSELKYFEASAVGTYTIATPIYSFKEAMRDDKFGKLCSASEWEESIEEAIKLVNKPDHYAELAKLSYSRTMDLYGWDRFGEKLVACFE